MSNMQPKEMSLEEIERILGYRIKLVPRTHTQVVNVPVGEIFQIGTYEFVVLKNGVKVLAVARNPIGADLFDKSSNCYDHSALSVGEMLKRFETELIANIGQTGLLSRKIDLTADNGFKDYKIAASSVAPMTLEEFRQFANVMERYPIDGDWWLATPHGTWSRNKSKDVCYINRNNMVEHAECDTVMFIRPMICLACSAMVGYDGEKRN
jgi:hypothetical protein